MEQNDDFPTTEEAEKFIHAMVQESPTFCESEKIVGYICWMLGVANPLKPKKDRSALPDPLAVHFGDVQVQLDKIKIQE